MGPPESGARLGRPRAKPPENEHVDPPEEILLAAAKLFTTDGYASTTTRQIAEAAGLRQASLFYYFPRKEDIFAELLDRTVEPALEYADQIRGLAGPPSAAVRLYLLTANDLWNLLRPPGNLGLLQLQREAHVERFSDFWKKRARLAAEYDALIEEGLRTGEFSVSDPEVVSPTICGVIESVCTWFDPDVHDMEQVRNAIGSVVLRAVSPDEKAVRKIIAEADGLAQELDAAPASAS